MSRERLRVFVSSRMEELAAERAAIRAALAELRIDAFVFEADAGARSRSIRETYLQEVERSDLYIGVFWRGYGRYTIEEYEHAATLGMDCLIYEKRPEVGGERDSELQAFLDHIGAVEEGQVTLKRFDTAEHLANLVKEDVAAWQTETIRGLKDRAASNLLVGVPSKPPPQFLGREEAIERMARRLRAGEDLAIDGLPGVGKTTLATALAHHPGVFRRFRDGILWASLGPEGDAASALAAWAEALEHVGLLKQDIAHFLDLGKRAQALRDAIGDRHMLLVIDDVWDVDSAELLRCGGRNCRHLLTTRDKEIAYRFCGGSPETLRVLDEDQAFQLLRELAPKACATDEDTARNLTRAVGGLPLVLRLIGGRLAEAKSGMFAGMFPELSGRALGEMANPTERLRLAQSRFGGDKVTLRETIAWSLKGLPDSATNAFYRLGAFAAKPERFDRAAAEAVTQADAESLVSLAARNLLEIDDENRRFMLHPIIADVARTGLDEAGVARHREHYLELAKNASKDWRQLEAAYGQIRWAWKQAPDTEVVFPFVGLLEHYQLRRGLVVERLEWARRALRVAESRDVKVAIAYAHMVIGRAQTRIGHHQAAVESLRRALAIWRESGERALEIDTLQDLGVALRRCGRADEALACSHNAVDLAVTTLDRRREAESLLVLALVLGKGNRVPEAMDCALRALQLYRDLNDRSGEADSLFMLGGVYQRSDQLDLALESTRGALAIRETLGHHDTTAEAHRGIARVHLEHGHLDDALREAQDALRLAEEAGDRSEIVAALDLSGDIRRKMNQPEEALADYNRCLAIEREMDNRSGQASALNSIGFLHGKQGRYEEALRSYEQALALYRGIEEPAEQAAVLLLIGYLHRDFGEPTRAIESFGAALEIYRTLDHRRGRADARSAIARGHFDLADYPRALETFEQAVADYAELQDRLEEAANLALIGRVHEELAHSDHGNRLHHIEHAIVAFREAGRLSPERHNLGPKLELLERKLRSRLASARDPRGRRRQDIERFGEKVVDRSPVVPAIAVEAGSELRRGWEAENGFLHERVRSRLTAVRAGLGMRTGVRIPEIEVRFGYSERQADEYLVAIHGVPRVTARFAKDRRLCPVPLAELEALGVAGEPTVNPQNGEPAVWVARAIWERLQGVGKELWDEGEYLARHLTSVIDRSLAEFIGHQEVMEMLEAVAPETARTLHERPVELSVLVVVLRTLVDEFVPIAALAKLVETFTESRRAGAGRLAIVEAIRCLPEVRPELPGNSQDASFYRLAPGVEETIARAIRVERSGHFLALEPADTQRILRLVGEGVRSRPATPLALIVEDRAIRRFVRRLVELEFPRLPVLSREELLPGLEENIVGEIACSSRLSTS